MFQSERTSDRLAPTIAVAAVELITLVLWMAPFIGGYGW